jgi:hypothetical protein
MMLTRYWQLATGDAAFVTASAASRLKPIISDHPQMAVMTASRTRFRCVSNVMQKSTAITTNTPEAESSGRKSYGNTEING